MARLIALGFAVILALGTPVAFAQATKDKPAAAATPPAAKATQLIDINSASAEELQTIKGIGDVYAKKIIENRPYRGKDELVSKKVLPKGVYDKVKGHIIAKQAPAK